jgi:hypothetical protein
MVISVVHPLQDRGGFRGAGPDAPFVLEADWFATTRFEGRAAGDRLAVDFAGWSRPLAAYVAAPRGAGFALTDLREPQPDPGPLPGHPDKARRVRCSCGWWRPPCPGDQAATARLPHGAHVVQSPMDAGETRWRHSPQDFRRRHPPLIFCAQFRYMSATGKIGE